MPQKLPISLCLHAIQDMTDDSAVTMSVLSVPFESPDQPLPQPQDLPYQCSYQYYDENGHAITTDIDEYTYITEYNRFRVPLAAWNHGSRVYYIAKAAATDPGIPIFCPPLLCRSDNGVIIVVEDDLPFITQLNHSDYDTLVFTNVQPNPQGCATLDISLAQAPVADLWAFVYYYVPNVAGLEESVVYQQFPVHYLNNKRFRMGFKAFYSDPAISNDCTLDVLPMVWVDFAIILPTNKEKG